MQVRPHPAQSIKNKKAECTREAPNQPPIDTTDFTQLLVWEGELVKKVKSNIR